MNTLSENRKAFFALQKTLRVEGERRITPSFDFISLSINEKVLKMTLKSAQKSDQQLIFSCERLLKRAAPNFKGSSLKSQEVALSKNKNRPPWAATYLF